MTPGEYVPDPTEGITGLEDLPQPRIQQRTRDFPSRRCPRCGDSAGRYARDTRTLHDLGNPHTGRPIDLFVTFSRHRCKNCGRCFAVDMTDLALPKCQYTRRVQDLAVRIVCEDRLTYQSASWHLWRDHRVFVPYATIQNWVEAAGEKNRDTLSTTYLDNALALDMHREQRAGKRNATTKCLHRARSPARMLKKLHPPRGEPQSRHSRC